MAYGVASTVFILAGGVLTPMDLAMATGGLGTLGPQQLGWLAGACPEGTFGHDAAIWDVVAFLRQMPAMTPNTYQQLSKGNSG